MILATVTTLLMAAASSVPRSTSAANAQIPTVESATAGSVLPSPSHGARAPRVDMMRIQ